MQPQKSTRIELSEDEALVLFDWLSRFNGGEHQDLFDAQAEQRALWNLEARLEKALVAPLASDYQRRLEEARVRLTDSET